MIAIQSSQPDEMALEIESSGAVALAHQHATTGLQENQNIADLLWEIANLLADQNAGEFRVRAYRNASEKLRELAKPVRDVLEAEGLPGLVELPTIGKSIANLIEQFLRVGKIPLLDRLRGDETAERLFATLPTLGPELSRRIHDALEIETLPELFAASCDGRLQQVPGIGRKRVRAVRECLAERLRHPAPPDKQVNEFQLPDDLVPLSELLDVDMQYRRLAKSGKLPKIAPRKFNPGGVAWLPILHTHRDDHHYTAMYSNTARAHELNTTNDWVIIYRDDPQANGRWTIITSQFGDLRGRRIVRGREDECSEHYSPE